MCNFSELKSPKLQLGFQDTNTSLALFKSPLKHLMGNGVWLAKSELQLLKIRNCKTHEQERNVAIVVCFNRGKTVIVACTPRWSLKCNFPQIKSS